jgi:hypothetical protein
MFGFFKSKKADVLSHWYSLVPDFNTSTHDFYATIEKELKERKVPGLESSRVEYAEGGALSDKRQYLHLVRERLTFDICAAPFGTSYFFSCRYAEPCPVVKIWQGVVLLLTTYAFLAVAWKWLGFITGSAVIAVCLACFMYIFRNAVALGLKDLDASLLKSPLFGPMYHHWFRVETYYRQDTRLMYLDMVDAVVKHQIEEVTAAMGVKLLRYNRHSPILDDLYRSTTVELPDKPKAT